MFFNSNSTYPFGLDISDYSLKIVQLNKKGDKVRIQAIGKIDLPNGYFENGEIKNREGIINSIKKLINDPKYGKITSSEVIACLPESKTFIKLIEVEKSDKMEEAIREEMEKHVPMGIDDTYYDWQIIEQTKDKIQVLVGAASKQTINQYTQLLSDAKLSIVALEIESVSLCRSLLTEESFKFKGAYNKNYALIDIGAKYTNLTVYSRNSILFNISIPISGEQLTTKIAQNLKIEEVQAENAKIIFGLDEKKAKGIIKNILSEMIKDLINEIKGALEFYENHFPDRGPLTKIVLAGGGANIKNLDKIIQENVSIETCLGDSLINLGSDARTKFSTILEETHSLNLDLGNIEEKTKKKIITLTQDTSLSYATALGLALRGIYIEGF